MLGAPLISVKGSMAISFVPSLLLSINPLLLVPIVRKVQLDPPLVLNTA